MYCSQDIVCLGEYCSCGDSITLRIASPVTGGITMSARFNGVRITRQVQVVAGQEITVPNIFNENFTHIIGFYSNGSPVWDNEYSIRTVICPQINNIQA